MNFYNYYKIGRFIFALTVFVSFHMVGLLTKIPVLFFILLIYVFIVLIRLLIRSERFFYADFILDIIFISSILYFHINAYSFLSLIYLLPIFFGSVLIKGRIAFFFPLFACFMYAISYYLDESILSKEAIFNFSLHGLSFVAIAFAGNAMRDKLENQEKYIKKLEDEKIKMESYRRLYRISADLAHELRNPLATISSAAQLLKEGRNDTELIEMLSVEAKRLSNLANDFLVYSRPSEAPQESVDIADIIKVLVAHKNNSKKLILDIENNAVVQGNRTYLEVATDNIIKNAIEAARSTVIITIRTEKKNLIIDIDDDGAGFDDRHIDRIFEPFFTTKKTGTGLGLAISYRIIESFGGTITYSTSSMGGAKFTIIMPVFEEG